MRLPPERELFMQSKTATQSRIPSYNYVFSLRADVDFNEPENGEKEYKLKVCRPRTSSTVSVYIHDYTTPTATTITESLSSWVLAEQLRRSLRRFFFLFTKLPSLLITEFLTDSFFLSLHEISSTGHTDNHTEYLPIYRDTHHERTAVVATFLPV